MILPVNSAQHSVSVKLLPNVLHLPSLLFIPKTKLKVYYPNIKKWVLNYYQCLKLNKARHVFLHDVGFVKFKPS